MNRYEIMLSSLQDFLKLDDPKIDKKDIQLKIDSLQIVKDKSAEEINALYDTGVFNSVTYDYLSAVMQNCNIAEDKKEEMLGELHWLLDTMSASQIGKKRQRDSEEESDMGECEEEWEK